MMELPAKTKQHSARPLSHCVLRAVIAGFLMVIASGCAKRSVDPSLTGPFHKVGNYYLTDQKLPAEVRRVAMLPLTTADSDTASRAGRQDLQPILLGEITKARLFEVTLVTPNKLEEWTGRPRWQQNDELPADFLVRLKEQTGCDAILFSQLSYYRAYPPLAIGWRLLLVKTDGQVVWSVDELFDAGEPAIINSVRRYVLENERTNAEFSQQIRTRPGTFWSTRVSGLEWLNSPRQFARYTANASVATLSPKP